MASFYLDLGGKTVAIRLFAENGLEVVSSLAITPFSLVAIRFFAEDGLESTIQRADTTIRIRRNPLFRRELFRELKYKVVNGTS